MEEPISPLATPFVYGSTASVVGFVIVCLFVVGCFLGAVYYSSRSTPDAENRAGKSLCRWSLGVLIYLVSIAWIVGTGVFRTHFLPLGPLFMVLWLSTAILIGVTKTGRRMSSRIPVEALVGFQIFRLPLEVILHQWALEGTVPPTMTWSGSNWDIVTGVLAMVAFGLVRNNSWIAWAFNGIGIALLLNVARVAVLSAPVPFGWNVQPPLELIAYLPYAYIVPVCVGGAAMGHVLLTLKLMDARSCARQREKTHSTRPPEAGSGV